MAHREHFGPGVGAADERIVGRHLALVREPQDLAAEGLGRLRIAASVRDVQHAVAAERDRAAAAAFTDEDVPRVGEPFAVPCRPRDGHACSRFFVERLGVADIDGAVAVEVRVQRQIRAGQPRPEGHRRAGHRLRIDHAVAHGLDGAAAFGHEDRVVRHECHAPRIPEAARVDAHANGLPLSGLVAHRRVGQGRNLDALWCHGRVAAHGHFLLGRQGHGEGRQHSGGEKPEESVHMSSPGESCRDKSNGRSLYAFSFLAVSGETCTSMRLL